MKHLLGSWTAVWCIAFLVLLSSPPARAFEVQVVTSPKGIKAWLVESHLTPIISMNFLFACGAANDPAGREGTAALMAAMLTEGAGELRSDAFKAKAENLSIGLNFSARSDFITGSMTTLTKNRDAAFDLTRMAITQPQFTAEDFMRIRAQSLSSMRQEALDQTSVASDTWYAKAFPGHIYGRKAKDTLFALENITVDDLRAFHQEVFSRKDLRVAVVGDIDAQTLGKQLDFLFGNLGEHSLNESYGPVRVASNVPVETIDFEGPQSAIFFGYQGLAGDGRQAWAGYLAAQILGGGAEFARLNQLLRETSGLTYGISLDNRRLKNAAFQIGSFTTDKTTANRALQILRDELERFAREGPTAEELRKVKSFAAGSYVLRFTNNASIAYELISAMEKGHPPDFANRRDEKIQAVTLDDVKQAAETMLKPENQIIIVVGRPL
jgi:zinc protease